MQQTDIPVRFPIPFANSAGSGQIRPIPTVHQTATATDAPASLTDGFPPETFVPAAAGGIPPNGKDFNGILKQITQWSRWQAAGGACPYDGAFASLIGGYPMGARITSSADASKVWISTADNNATDPDGSSAANWEAQATQDYVDAATTGAAILTKLLAVGGPGSGLDADLLDGYHAGAFALRGQDVVFAIVDAATPGGGTTGGVRIRTDDTGVGILQITNRGASVQYGFFAFGSDGSASWNGAAGLRSGSSPVWHAGNDGAGSGLDADLWRGMAPGDLPVLGVGQSLYNMMGSRAINTAYQNTYGRPIFVAIQADGNVGSIDISQNGTTWISLATTIDHGQCQTVLPAGWFVRVSGSPVIQAWAEIR